MMNRFTVLAYGLVSYLLALATIAYSAGFVSNIYVSRTIDAPPNGSVLSAVLIDLALLTIFALQHSLMARQPFKQWLAKLLPAAAVRSTFVFCSSVALVLVIAFWRPIGGVIWHVEGTLAVVLTAVSAAGWVLVLASTFAIDHFELFGVKPVWRHFQGRAEAAEQFRLPKLYRVVRHPLYLGFIIAFWAAPTMTLSHAFFALGTTIYILCAIRFEERDLVRQFGEKYARYREQVPMIVPVTFGRAVDHRAERSLSE